MLFFIFSVLPALGASLEKEKNQSSYEEYNDNYADYYEEHETPTTIFPKIDPKDIILKTTKALTTATAIISKNIEEELEYNMADYDDDDEELGECNEIFK